MTHKLTVVIAVDEASARAALAHSENSQWTWATLGGKYFTTFGVESTPVPSLLDSMCREPHTLPDALVRPNGAWVVPADFPAAVQLLKNHQDKLAFVFDTVLLP